MIGTQQHIGEILGRIVALLVFCTMLFPAAMHAVAVITESEHAFELMVLDQQEESEKEEQQEDDSKDEKIEMQNCTPLTAQIPFAPEHGTFNPLDAAIDFFIEIPLPPPERM